MYNSNFFLFSVKNQLADLVELSIIVIELMDF